MKLITKNFNETIALGIELGRLCNGGEIFALCGELGAGKTILTKGIGVGLGVSVNVVSPTFMLVRVYSGTGFQLIHFDFYRLDSSDDFYSIGFEDYLDKNNVVVIEWAEKFLRRIPPPYIKVEITVLDEERREINFEIFGDMKKIEEFLKQRCENDF